MRDAILFWVSIVLSFSAQTLVVLDWYLLHRKYALSKIPNIVNRVFMFFCLAMLTSNAIMVGNNEFSLSLGVSTVVILTELMFMLTDRVKQ